MSKQLNNLYVGSKQSSIFVSLCFLLFLSFSSSGIAAVWLFDPRVKLQQEYDDNYRLSSDSSNEDEVWTTKLTGELAMRGKTDRSDIEALIRLDTIEYSGDDDRLNDKDNQLFGLSSRYEVNDRNTAGLNAKYRRDTILRNAEIFVDPGDSGAFPDDDIIIDDSTDLDSDLVRENVRRERLELNPRWAHEYNEVTRFGLDYTYYDISLDNEEGTNLVESESHRFRGNLSRDLSEKNTIGALVSAGYFEPDNGQDVDNYEASVSLDHKYSNTFSMDFLLGGRYSEFDEGNKSDDTGFIATLGGTKRTERTRYRIEYRRDVAPSSSGNAVEVNEVSTRAIHKINERLRFTLNASWFDTDTLDSSNSNSDRQLIRIKPGLRYRFSDSWVINGAYVYKNRDQDSGGSADSNAAFISFGYSPPSQF